MHRVQKLLIVGRKKNVDCNSFAVRDRIEIGQSVGEAGECAAGNNRNVVNVIS
jgi:hypothetical protein